MVLKGEFESKTIIVGDFNPLVTSMNISSRWKKKINLKTLNLNNTLDNMNLIDIDHSMQKQKNIHSS